MSQPETAEAGRHQSVLANEAVELPALKTLHVISGASEHHWACRRYFAGWVPHSWKILSAGAHPNNAMTSQGLCSCQSHPGPGGLVKRRHQQTHIPGSSRRIDPLQTDEFETLQRRIPDLAEP